MSLIIFCIRGSHNVFLMYKFFVAVLGSILIIASVVVGRLLVSNKWRMNQQPAFARQQTSSLSAEITTQAEDETRHNQQGVETLSPPPYSGTAETNGRLSNVAVYIIDRGIVNLTMPTSDGMFDIHVSLTSF